MKSMAGSHAEINAINDVKRKIQKKFIFPNFLEAKLYRNSGTL